MEKAEQMDRDPELTLAAALDLGERMLVSGGEVGRVEDTIARICRAYGAEKVDVLTITESIIVTVYAPEWGFHTQTRRISSQQYDLTALTALNELSRRVCARPMEPKQFIAELKRIDALPVYRGAAMLGVWALVAAGFCVLFGGGWLDMLCSAAVGALLRIVYEALQRLRLNRYVAVIICSILGGFLARLPLLAGLPVHPAAISIGDIMLLIPGIALTNSMRDMFTGDTISGLLRSAETLAISLAIAWGFAISSAGADVGGDVSTLGHLAAAFLGALGFGMLFNLRGRNLLLGAAGGAMAWALVMLGQYTGIGETLSYFLVSMVVTLWSEIMARVRRCPATVFLVSGTIVLVPGGALYRTMRFALASDWSGFGAQGLSTMLCAIAISSGIICVTALASALRRLRNAGRA